MEADWLKGGRQEDDRTVMMSVLTQTAWETGSDVKNRLVAERPGKKADDYIIIQLTHKLHFDV